HWCVRVNTGRQEPDWDRATAAIRRRFWTLFLMSILAVFAGAVPAFVIALDLRGYLQILVGTAGWLMIALSLLFAWLLTTLRCPRCSHPAILHRVPTRGGEWVYWGFLNPGCPRCGLEL